MAQASGLPADAHLVLEMIAETLNKRDTAGVDKDIEDPEGLISLLIIYFMISDTMPHPRAIVVSEFFQRFQAIIKRYDGEKTFNAYFRFGLPVLDKFSLFGVSMDHDHWIRVKAVGGMFTAASLWADLGVALAAQQDIVVSRRGVAGNSTMQVSVQNDPNGGGRVMSVCDMRVFYPAPT